MTYGSSVPYVIDGLFALLSARPGLSGVTVLDAYPRNPGEFTDVVFVGREGQAAVDLTASWPVLGHAFVDEVYTLWLTCQSLKDTSSGTEIEARQSAYTYAGEVIGTVLADPTLAFVETATHHSFEVGGRGHDAQPYAVTDGGGWLSSDGHGWRVQIGLNVTCRLALT